MIEVVYKKEESETGSDIGFKLPKNIKQIGDGQSDIQVYLEDNVAVYLNKLPENDGDIRYGVLLGHVKRSCGYTYIFISGAVEVREVFDNTILFTDDIWTGINDDVARYFRGLRVVGWFLNNPYSSNNQNMWVKKVHLSNFAGNDKVFFRLDRDEEEEYFYYYGYDRLDRLPCYHIYYEKNPQMIDYMTMAGVNKIQRKIEAVPAGSKSPVNSKAPVSSKAPVNSKAQDNGKQTIKMPAPKDLTKFNKWLGRAASVAVICALATTLAVMGRQGQLDNLANSLKTIVSDIMGDDDDGSNGSGTIQVNGIPSVQTPAASGEQILDSTSTSQENTTISDQSTGDTETTTVPEETTEGQNDTTPEETTEPATVSTLTPVNTSTYLVKEGDTLYGICMELYGNANNMEIIMELNNLESADEIYYGENLIVP